MTFDPLRRGAANRDRRDDAFAKSVIAAAAQRLRLMEPPEYYRDLRPEDRDKACHCGAAWHLHYDGWDGNRLSCKETVYRHPIAVTGSCEIERCLFCSTQLSGNVEIRDEHYPYCSAECAYGAEKS